jgi:hypothetical protein
MNQVVFCNLNYNNSMNTGKHTLTFISQDGIKNIIFTQKKLNI